MPLMHKESKKAFQHNVKEEMDAHPGRSAQDLAIAYAIQKKARKEHEAQGGDMHMCSGGACEHPSHKMAEGGEVSKRERAMRAFIGSYQPESEPDVDGGDAHPMAEEHVYHTEAHDSHVEHAVENQEGDEDEGAGSGNEIHPMVMKIMMGRAKGYSKGGVVANEHQESADEMPNEFDDLPLDDHLEAHENASNEIGDDVEDHELVKKVLKSRKGR